LPKDEPRRSIFIEFIKKQVPTFIPRFKTKICSKHFPKEQILGGSKKILMPVAVPVGDNPEVLFVGNKIKIL
jgi:hypothetical protein